MRRIGVTLALSVGVLAMIAAIAAAGVEEVVVLDECDPATFDAALGPGTCMNVAGTAKVDLFVFRAALPTGHEDWLFYPTEISIKKGDILIATNQGGEVHTFTEVKEFGNGFVPPLNNPTGSTAAVPECAGGFSIPAVASTRVIQGSSLQVTGLEKGTHRFECCIHPWMRVVITPHH